MPMPGAGFLRPPFQGLGASASGLATPHTSPHPSTRFTPRRPQVHPILAKLPRAHSGWGQQFRGKARGGQRSGSDATQLIHDGTARGSTAVSMWAGFAGTAAGAAGGAGAGAGGAARGAGAGGAAALAGSGFAGGAGVGGSADNDGEGVLKGAPKGCPMDCWQPARSWDTYVDCW